MPLLDQEIATYERLRASLEAEHHSKWAVIHGETYVGAYPTFDEAVREAVRRFGRGPYLIREIGAPPLRNCVPSAWCDPATLRQEVVFLDQTDR